MNKHNAVTSLEINRAIFPPAKGIHYGVLLALKDNISRNNYLIETLNKKITEYQNEGINPIMPPTNQLNMKLYKLVKNLAYNLAKLIERVHNLNPKTDASKKIANQLETVFGSFESLNIWSLDYSTLSALEITQIQTKVDYIEKLIPYFSNLISNENKINEMMKELLSI